RQYGGDGGHTQHSSAPHARGGRPVGGSRGNPEASGTGRCPRRQVTILQGSKRPATPFWAVFFEPTSRAGGRAPRSMRYSLQRRSRRGRGGRKKSSKPAKAVASPLSRWPPGSR